MKKLLSEEKVKRKLGVKSFYELSKKQYMQFASMLNQMDPEVAKKALEQFPDFAQNTKEILSEYKETIHKVMENNQQSSQAYYDMSNEILASLIKELNKDELSCEERHYIMEKMFELQREIGAKDSENKKFLASLAVCGTMVVTVAIGALVSALGGSTQPIGKNDDKLS